MIDYILTCAFIGLVATMGMTAFLWAMTHLKICNVDMVKALGSYYTQKESNALLPGLLAHITGGIVFAFIYIFLFNVMPTTTQDIPLYMIFGGGMGFVHGIVFALFLVIVVAEHHPLSKFKSAGFATGAYHFVAHIIYGLIVGTLYGYLLLGKVLTQVPAS